MADTVILNKDRQPTGKRGAAVHTIRRLAAGGETSPRAICCAIEKTGRFSGYREVVSIYNWSLKQDQPGGPWIDPKHGLKPHSARPRQPRTLERSMVGLSPKSQLTEFWANFDFDKPPYIHPSDQATGMLTERRFLSGVTDLDTYARSEYYGKNSTLLHSYLLPSPFAGDLRRGDIFVLMLNPGFSIGEYFGERQLSLRRALRATLDQKLENEEFAFIWLNPELSFHPGFGWWSGKLQKLIQQLASRWKLSHYEASRKLSRRFVGLEMFPYHSQSFNPTHVDTILPSTQVMVDYVKGLGERAKSGKVLVIVRSQKAIRGAWSLPNCECVYVFPRNEAQRPSLTPDHDAGRKILEFIDRNPMD